jgi:hypothetical protein
MILPAWPDPATDEGATFFASAKKLYALYRAAGEDRPFAFGMMTMAEAEASFDPNALGDYEDAAGNRKRIVDPDGTVRDNPAYHSLTAHALSYGAHQRKEDRCNAIRDGRPGVPGLGFDIRALALAGANTLENEARSVLWELMAFPKGYNAAAIRGAKSAWGVAYNATISFEKAGTAIDPKTDLPIKDGAAEKRGAAAETWVMLASGGWPVSRGPAPDGWQALAEGWV